MLLMKLKQTNPCVFLRGNHESLTLDWMHTHNENLQWLSHGGLATVAAYRTISNEEKQEHRSFLEDLAYYHLDDENRLFVHGGFTNQRGVEAEFFKEYLCWDRTLWEMALAINPKIPEDDLMYPKRLKNYKEIFIGHTPVTHCGFTIPTQAAKVWNIDTGAAFQGKVSIMDVDSKEFYMWNKHISGNFRLGNDIEALRNGGTVIELGAIPSKGSDSILSGSEENVIQVDGKKINLYYDIYIKHSHWYDFLPFVGPNYTHKEEHYTILEKDSSNIKNLNGR